MSRVRFHLPSLPPLQPLRLVPSSGWCHPSMRGDLDEESSWRGPYLRAHALGVHSPPLSYLPHRSPVVADALWALRYLSDSEQGLDVILHSNHTLCARVVARLAHPLPIVQRPALSTIGNLCHGDDEQTQAAINAGALPALGALLSSPVSWLRKVRSLVQHWQWDLMVGTKALSHTHLIFPRAHAPAMHAGGLMERVKHYGWLKTSNTGSFGCRCC